MATLLFTIAPERLSASDLQRLQDLASGFNLVISEDREKWQEVIGDAEIVAGWVSRSIIQQAVHLRWYQQWGAGVDWLMQHPDLVRHPFVLTNVSGIHAVPISEHILALLLALNRRLPSAWSAQRQHVWESLPGESLTELAGKTMLLIGLGAIGQRTARIAHALEMRVLGVRYNPDKTLAGFEKVVGFEEILDILPEADYVVLTTPLTPLTKGIIDRQALQRMKKTAYIVNIGRGELIDEKALVEALQVGQIAGAGLDVVESEPLYPDSPLWDMENVIITAHYAGASPVYHQRAMAIFLENLARYQCDEPLINVVDKNQYL